MKRSLLCLALAVSASLVQAQAPQTQPAPMTPTEAQPQPAPLPPSESQQAQPAPPAGAAGPVAGGQTPVRQSGDILTGPNGMTLYVFDKDTADSGKSSCSGKCAENWPPLTARDTDRPSGDYGIVTRDDGTKQWSYKGKPLYYWVKDKQPGDRTGDNFNNVWHVARP